MNLEKMCELQIQYYNRMQAILAKEQIPDEKEIGAKNHRDVKQKMKSHDTGKNLPH